jgi:hypothetical protein
LVGQGRGSRRRQWIAPYVAGPVDKPLKMGDRVWALRRDPGQSRIDGAA